MPRDLRPIRQRGVEKVVWARPDVEEYQRPEMDDRQPVREHRPIGRLRDEVIHQPEKRRRQEEGDGVVAVPPLHQRILDAGIHRVALEEADRKLQRIDDVQQRDGDERGEVKPDRHVHVPLAAAQHGADQIPAETHPDGRDQDIDRPLELRIFLARGEAQRKRERGEHDDELPAPEVNRTQPIAEHPRLAQPLQGVVHGDEDRVPAKGEYRGIRVQRPQAAVGQLRDAA